MGEATVHQESGKEGYYEEIAKEIGDFLELDEPRFEVVRGRIFKYTTDPYVALEAVPITTEAEQWGLLARELAYKAVNKMVENNIDVPTMQIGGDGQPRKLDILERYWLGRETKKTLT